MIKNIPQLRLLPHIGLLFAIAILFHPIVSQNASSTLDGALSPSIAQESQLMRISENGTTNSTTEPECVDICQGLSFYFCMICYKQCTSNNVTTLEMKTCQFKYCSWWQSQRYSEDNPTNTYTRCTVWETQLLPEDQCTNICCASQDYVKFTPDTMAQCVEANRSLNKQENLVATIVVAGIGGFLLIIIVLVFSCWCRHKIIVCCKDVSYCFQYVFTLGKVDVRSSTQQVESDDSKQKTRPDRNNRKWQNHQRKKEVSQLPTSKYIIQSQYEINPEIYCSICLDDGLNCQTACGHSYHFLCLRESLTKKMTCRQCSDKKFNPLKITCDTCRDRYTTYQITKKNVETKYPDFYHKGKIYCDECFENLQTKGSQ